MFDKLEKTNHSINPDSKVHRALEGTCLNVPANKHQM